MKAGGCCQLNMLKILDITSLITFLIKALCFLKDPLSDC
jgi:hypothetical protein